MLRLSRRNPLSYKIDIFLYEDDLYYNINCFAILGSTHARSVYRHQYIVCAMKVTDNILHNTTRLYDNTRQS